MSLENYKINTYSNPVASLPDKPSEMGMTAAELKAAFDANANNEIKESINAVIDHVVSQDESNANTFENKVDKEEGKGLSANDYTDEEKELVAQITNKVEKEEGKGLSVNDYSNEEKQKVADAHTDKHTHENKEVLDGVTAEKVAEWDSKVDAEYVNDTVNEKITELGGADMMQATYDPQGKQTDVFKYVDDAVNNAVDGITAEDVGAAKSEEHLIKSYTTYTQLGLTIDDMVADDFNGNIAKIVEAMPNFTVLEMNAYDSKLANSVVNKINAELPAIGLNISNDFVLRIEKTTKAFPAKVDAIIDSSTYSRIFTCIVHYVDSSSSYVVTPFAMTYSHADAGYHADATSGRTATIFAGTDGRTYIRNVKDSNNRSALFLNPETLTDSEMQGFLRLQKVVAGTPTYYDVYGTHNIKKSTTDLTAGTSTLTTGTIYLVYE